MYLINALTLDSDEEIGHGPHRNSNTPIMVPPRNVYRGSLTAYYFDPCLQVAPSTNLGDNKKNRSSSARKLFLFRGNYLVYSLFVPSDPVSGLNILVDIDMSICKI